MKYVSSPVRLLITTLFFVVSLIFLFARAGYVQAYPGPPTVTPEATSYPGPTTPTPEPTIEITSEPCEPCDPTDVGVSDVGSGSGGFIVWGLAAILLGVMTAVRLWGKWA